MKSQILARMSWEWLNWFQVTDLWAVTYAKEFAG